MQAAKNTPETNKKFPTGVEFMNPQEIVKDMDVRPGMKIADFGCGTGYFSLPLAQAVGKEGLVWSLDVLKSKLESVKSQAKLLGLNNIKPQWANLEKPEGSKLNKEEVDWVILVNMLFQNNRDGRKKVIQEAKRVLKKGGMILVIEWNDQNFSFGPDKSLRISKEEMTRMAHEHGLGILKELAIGDLHYGLILGK